MLSSALSPWRHRLWIVLTRGAIFFVAPLLGVVVPAYYDAIARVPPPAQWHVTVGLLEVVVPENVRHHGVISHLRVDGQVFQCGGSWLQPSNCLAQGKRRQFLDGQPAQATWFAQTVFPGMTRSRVIELVVGDHVVISRQDTSRLLQQRPNAVSRLLGMTLLGAGLMLLAGMAIVGAQARWRERQQALPPWERR